MDIKILEYITHLINNRKYKNIHEPPIYKKKKNYYEDEFKKKYPYINPTLKNFHKKFNINKKFLNDMYKENNNYDSIYKYIITNKL